jgi:hypothetical protein
MQVRWELPARMFAEQLSKREQETLYRNIELLANDWEARSKFLKRVRTEAAGSAYTLNVGNDLRVVLARHGNTLIIVDLVRRSQLKRLRDIVPKHD